MVAILAAIFVTAGICYLVLGHSNKVSAIFDDTGVRIPVRIMGLLLVALAVLYFVNGLVDLGAISSRQSKTPGRLPRRRSSCALIEAFI